jgi:5-methylcytosine-specific restriction enzyme A
VSRSVEEWVGASDDAAIPPRVKLRVWERCAGKCGLTGKKLLVGDAYDFDHIVPLSMGGRHAENNLHVVARQAHREKTAQEAGVRAKADRVRLKHIGAYPKPKRKLQGRGFEKRAP